MPAYEILSLNLQYKIMLSTSFLIVLALFAIAAAANAHPAPTHISELEICSSQGATTPALPVFNSVYSVFPDGSLCCPPDYYPENNYNSYCISKEEMADKCGKEYRGINHEPCFQCYRCAKLIGELCHGPYKAHGRCDKDRGLECLNGGRIPSGFDDNYAIGVCTTTGGPCMDRGLGESCGGWQNSVGNCFEGLTCPNKGNSTAICGELNYYNHRAASIVSFCYCYTLGEYVT